MKPVLWKKFWLTTLFIFTCVLYSCLSEASDSWPIKGSDTCKKFINSTKNLDISNGQTNLIWQDPQLLKLKTDITSKALSEGWYSQDSNEALRDITTLIHLYMYCEKYPQVHLDHIKGSDIVSHTKTVATPELQRQYKASQDWYKYAISVCKIGTECFRIATSYINHSKACLIENNKQACSDVERDRKDWDTISSASTPAIASAGNLTQCLQEAATKAVAYCREENCPSEIISDLIRKVQQTRCGYSAISEDKPIYSTPIQSPRFTDCTTNRDISGQAKINCIEY
jgi:hypothetical protein